MEVDQEFDRKMYDFVMKMYDFDRNLIGVRGCARTAYVFPGCARERGSVTGKIVFFLFFCRPFFVRETSVPDIKAQQHLPWPPPWGPVPSKNLRNLMSKN